MYVTDSPQELAHMLSLQGIRLVLVDGAHGSGKSTLASTLGGLLNARVIEADSFLRKNQGSYFPNLDLKSLRASIDPACICILEGICMLQVIRALQLKPDAVVYVKRMARWGWADEDDLVPSSPVETHLAQLKEQASQFSDSDEEATLGLWEEVIRYHVQFAPHTQPDFVYLRSDA
jgi:energy-coupling factor transporter ATP-binding protein EcfA2